MFDWQKRKASQDRFNGLEALYAYIWQFFINWIITWRRDAADLLTSA